VTESWLSWLKPFLPRSQCGVHRGTDSRPLPLPRLPRLPACLPRLAVFWSLSQYFFRPDADTSPHPLIIGAGFDGTGLTVLSRALAILGRTRTRLPAIDMSQCRQGRGEAKACGPLLQQLDEVGLQARRAMASGTHDFQEAVATPQLFEDADAVMGHPVPHFTWDFLEAFPNGKVVLTVGAVEDVWRVVEREPFCGMAHNAGKGVALLRALVWNLGNTPITRAHFTRKYLEHNAKIIHGVPKHQLLVWNPYKDPSWGPLCEFLGVEVPNVPFPTPVVGEW
jgi:hypothetical protein